MTYTNFKNRFFAVIFIFFILFEVKINAQQNVPRFTEISVDKGLSQSVVMAIDQDTTGFIWLGTQDGLNRYDGYGFKIFKHNPKDTSSLSDNYITGILTDESGVLWISTNGGGLNKYNEKLEKFTHFVHDSSNPKSLISNYIKFLYRIPGDTSGAFWIGTYENGMDKYFPSENRAIHYSNNPLDPNSLSNNRIYSITAGEPGILWIATANGLNRLNLATNQIKVFKHDPQNVNSLSDNYIRSLLYDKKGNLWIGTDSGGLDKVNTATMDFTHYINNPSDPNSISSNSINSITQDSNGKIWIGTWGGGLCLYMSKTDNFSVYKNNPSNPNSLSDNDIISVFIDRNNIIWTSVYGHGVNKMNNAEVNFEHFVANPSNPGSLKGQRVAAIYQEKDGTIWVGTIDGGLNRYDSKAGKFKYYTHDSNNPNSIAGNRVTSIIKDKFGRLWIGTTKGISIFNRKSDNFFNIKNVPGLKNTLSSNNIRKLFSDSNGMIWIGTIDKGLDKFNINTGKFTHYSLKKPAGFDLSNDRVEAIAEDKNGKMWIGTFFGLNILDPVSGKITKYFRNSSDPRSLSYDRISTIFMVQDSTMWLGTFGGGLDKAVFSTGTDTYYFVNYSTEAGLPNDFIYRILEDSTKNLWISTNKGLSRFNIADGYFTNYDITEGLQSNEFKEGAFYNKKTGEMFFGGINGFNAFFPDSIKTDLDIPPVVLTKLKIFNRQVPIGRHSVLKESITYANNITLSYKDYVFSIEFSALEFENPGRNQYAYKLEGFEDNWNYTDAQHRVVTYTNLSGGNYIFKVKASNSGGVWSAKAISLNITITPPFWETWWFALTVIIIIISVIYIGYKWRVRIIESNNKRLEKLVAERTTKLEELNSTKDKFFSIIAHDLRGPFNTLLGATSLLSLDIKSLSTQDIEKFAKGMNESAENLYKLLDNLLQWARAQMEGLHPVKTDIDIVQIIQNNINIIRHNAKEKGIEINYTPDKRVLSFADYNMVNTVVRNILSNSVKFTDTGGLITITTSIIDHQINVTIKDNGLGMSKDQVAKVFNIAEKKSTPGTRDEKGTGLGLVLCKDFIEMNGGEISIESIKGRGTEVNFTLPVSG